MFEYFPYMGN